VGRPYRFNGDDFIEFIGWFVTEGSVTWRTHKETALVQIAQKTASYRREIAALFDRMEIPYSETDGGYQFSSTVFGSLMEHLCGTESRTKHLPAFVWQLPPEQKRLLWQTLMDGDGDDRGVYSTASERLREDVLRLGVELGLKPRYSHRGGIWRVSPKRVIDGFRGDRNVEFHATERDCYRLSVTDYSIVLAGRNGKFQWASVSEVV
jgi:DNA polymerase I